MTLSLSAIALLYVVLSSIGWAGFDATRKELAATMAPVPMVLVLMFGQVPFFAIWTWQSGHLDVESGYYLPMAVSTALNIAANLLFVRAIAISPISVTIPLLSLSPMFTVLVAIPLVNEVPSSLQVLGIAAIVAGAFLVNSPPGERPSIARMWQAYRGELGAVFMTIVAFLWSLSATLDKIAAGHSSEPFHGMIQCLGVGAAMLGYLAVHGRLGEVKTAGSRPVLVLGSLSFGVAALGFQLLAFAHTQVGLVEAVKRAIGMTSALVVGKLVYEEAITTSRIAGVLVMAVGVAVVLFG